jgi:hypothetical protein
MTAAGRRGPAGLREIGTGYVGKEPAEYVVDVARMLVRLTGRELLFEGCLTSRPFTCRTFIKERPGAMAPGRGDATGADRVRLDLADALGILRASGWDCAALPFLPGSIDPGHGQAVVAGPLRVEGRWCPVPDRLLSGEAWRYVVVERWSGPDAICLDPLFGGYTSISARQLGSDGADIILVTAPRKPPDASAIAGRCHRAGVTARAQASSETPGRDAAGLVTCADLASEMSARSAAHRLRLSLQNLALQALRWSCLLGHLESRDISMLTLADVLRESFVACRGAHHAVMVRDTGQLERLLRRLALSAEVIDELSARIAESGP